MKLSPWFVYSLFVSILHDKINKMKYFHTTFLVLIFIYLLLFPNGLKAQDDLGIITFDVGFFTITLLPELQQQSKTDMLLGATDEMLKETIPDGTFPNAVNAFLVETEDKTVLFDTGYGKRLFDNLKAYGKTTNDIDVIMLTHMHGDHIGGLLQEEEMSFPNATLYISQSEYDYWMSDDAMRKVPENRQSNFINARSVIDAYKDQLHLFKPGKMDDSNDLIPGIRSIALCGHTPGHTGYMLESDGSQLFIWGDLTHAMAIQMAYPEVDVTGSMDMEQAIETRRQLFKYISDNNISIAGMHIQYPAIGTVTVKEPGKYSFFVICECEGR